MTTVKTIPAKTQFNLDVFLLLVLFGLTMYGSQKVMTLTQPPATDPQQKAMQDSMGKMMPFMVMAMFVIIPIPAGVLLYMVTSNIIQVGQTVAINKYLEYQEDKEKLTKPKTIPIEKPDDDEPVIITNTNPVTAPNQQMISRREKKKKKKSKNNY